MMAESTEGRGRRAKVTVVPGTGVLYHCQQLEFSITSSITASEDAYHMSHEYCQQVQAATTVGYSISTIKTVPWNLD